MEGYLAEIRMFAGNFSPRGWYSCSGQVLSISANTALFALLGTTYGGDGQTTFALPDFRGRRPIGVGQGAGLGIVDLGQAFGAETNTLIVSHLPPHNHLISGTITQGANAERVATTGAPSGNYPSIVNVTSAYSTTADSNTGALSHNLSLGVVGSGAPISLQSPYLGINLIICAEGIFPSRD
jgi:microcystin-dependent protein